MRVYVGKTEKQKTHPMLGSRGAEEPHKNGSWVRREHGKFPLS